MVVWYSKLDLSFVYYIYIYHEYFKNYKKKRKKKPTKMDESRWTFELYRRSSFVELRRKMISDERLMNVRIIYWFTSECFLERSTIHPPTNFRIESINLCHRSSSIETQTANYRNYLLPYRHNQPYCPFILSSSPIPHCVLHCTVLIQCSLFSHIPFDVRPMIATHHYHHSH